MHSKNNFIIKLLKKVDFKQFENQCWPPNLRSLKKGYGRVNLWGAPVINKQGCDGS